jgi:hypothetical protein
MWYDRGLEVMDVLMSVAMIVVGGFMMTAMVCAAIGAYLLSRADSMKP